MLTKKIAEKIKDIIERIYTEYGCKDLEVSAIYRDENGAECKLTARREIRPALVTVNNDGTANVLINSEDPYLGEKFFGFLEDVKKLLKENEFSIEKAGFVYDFYMVSLTYNS